MEDTLIENIAFWGLLAVGCTLVGLILVVTLLLTKRKTGPSKAQEADLQIGNAIISRIDSLDDLISNFTKKHTDPITLRQLKVIREDLIKLLQSQSIEAFALEKGTLLDPSARQLIQILESETRGGKKRARILETVRIGYRYQKDPGLPSTIVRKPMVKIG